MNWGEKQIYVHVFYNQKKAVSERMKLIAKVNEMFENAVAEPHKFIDNKKYLKFFEFIKIGENFSINVKENEIENTIRHVGWLVIISNSVDSPKDALRIYRTKDVGEKGFDKLKNNLDLGRLRIHGNNAAQNKYFIGFIALILSSYIHNVMIKNELDKKYTLKQLICVLQKHKVTFISDNRILSPPTKEHREIYSAFGIKRLVGI